MQYIQLEDVGESVADYYQNMDNAERRRLLILLSTFGIISAPYIGLLIDIFVVGTDNQWVLRFTHSFSSIVQWFYLLAALCTICYAAWRVCEMIYRRCRGRGYENEEEDLLMKNMGKLALLSGLLRIVGMINKSIGENIEKKI